MGWVMGLSSSEWLFYGGIALMAIAVLAALPTGIAIFYSGRKLKQKLEEEYGKPQR